MKILESKRVQKLNWEFEELLALAYKADASKADASKADYFITKLIKYTKNDDESVAILTLMSNLRCFPKL